MDPRFPTPVSFEFKEFINGSSSSKTCVSWVSRIHKWILAFQDMRHLSFKNLLTCLLIPRPASFEFQELMNRIKNIYFPQNKPSSIGSINAPMHQLNITRLDTDIPILHNWPNWQNSTMHLFHIPRQKWAHFRCELCIVDMDRCILGFVKLVYFNSLWPSDAILQQRSAITWTNVDWSSVKSSDIHIRVNAQEMPQPSITKLCLKITYLKFH